MFDSDFKELLSAFDACKVRFLVVGGYAVSFHAQPRATRDLDIFVARDADNAQAVYRALAEFGAPVGGLSPEDFMGPDTFFPMGSAPVLVDILPSIAGMDFEVAWKNRVRVEVDAETGLTAWFISGHDLIVAKVAAGRPQDIADAAALREADRYRISD